jgi:hypothetical protein
MKSNFLMGCIAMIFLTFLSCQKSPDTNFTETDTVLDAVTNTTAESQDALTTVEDLENDMLEARDGGTCPMVSRTTPKGSFPTVITVDFGTGCLTANGRFHSGKIIIEQSDSMRKNGATRITTFENFGIDSLRLKNGSVTLKNEGKNDNGNPKFSRKITDMVIEGPNGQVNIRSLHTRTLVKGDDTEDRADDVWKIEGETIGTSDDHVVFSAYIREALVRKGDCPYIVAGKEVVTRKGRTAVIDYGDGTCDRFAVVTLENGNKRIIKLRPRD